MATPPDIFERTAARVTRNIEIIGVAGASVAFAWKGWQTGLGFALGAIGAWFNFRWLKGFVGGLGPNGNPGPSGVFFAIRYLILAAGAYVILKYSRLSLPAALLGLFTPLAAVIVEVLIQLTYARRDLDH